MGGPTEMKVSHECLRRLLRSLKEVINGAQNRLMSEKYRFETEKKLPSDLNPKPRFQNSVYLSTPRQGGSF